MGGGWWERAHARARAMSRVAVSEAVGVGEATEAARVERQSATVGG